MNRPLLHQICQGYHLMERIGRGGIAEVYRGVRESNQNQQCAVKVMHAEAAGDSAKAKAFRREYDLLAGIDHPLIPKARSWTALQQRPAIIMDLVPGKSLAQLRHDNAALDWLDQFIALVDLAAELHAQSIVHGDLKLENVLLRPDGRLGLVDFGSAHRVNALQSLTNRFTKRKSVFGTLTYMAPEVVRGRAAIFRSDCYSLGICGRVLLGDRQPFGEHKDQRSLMKAVVGGFLTPAQNRLPDLPHSLATLLDACTHPEPKFRPVDAQEMAATLQACLAQAREHRRA